MRAGGRGRIAARLHRISGVALALFLPFHFLALGLALEGADALDRFLSIAELPLVKAAEWGLVTVLGLHLTLGLRLLAIELLPWAGLREGLIWAGIGATALVGLVFLAGVA